jgi:hypothetical protein
MKSKKSKNKAHSVLQDYVPPVTYQELRALGYDNKLAYAMLSKEKVRWLVEKDVRVTETEIMEVFK